MGTPIPSRKHEKVSAGAGVVTTRKMTPEEMASMGRPDRMTRNGPYRATWKKAKEESDLARPSKVTLDEYRRLKQLGYDDKEIAQKWGISTATLKNYHFPKWGISAKNQDDKVMVPASGSARRQSMPPGAEEPSQGSPAESQPEAQQVVDEHPGGPVNHPSHYHKGPAITTRAESSLVTSHLVKLRGTCADGQPVTDSMPTITAGGMHVGEVRAFLLKYYGSADNCQQLNEPLHTVTTKDRFGLVTIEGVDYQIVDIGMRMLEPHELFAAQGFPPEYIIDRYADGKAVPKSAQVARCGNSVCPSLATALVRANLPELCVGSGKTLAFERYVSAQAGQLQLSI